MHDLKKIYICSHCGEVDGFYYEHIDCDRDKIIPSIMCNKCHIREVRPKIENGLECYRQMTGAEVLAEQGFFDPESDDWDEEYDWD